MSDRRVNSDQDSLLIPYLESMREDFTRIHEDMREGFKENREGIGNVHRRIDDLEERMNNSLMDHVKDNHGTISELHNRLVRIERVGIGGSAVVGAAGVAFTFKESIAKIGKALGIW